VSADRPVASATEQKSVERAFNRMVRLHMDQRDFTALMLDFNWYGRYLYINVPGMDKPFAPTLAEIVDGMVRSDVPDLTRGLAGALVVVEP
jgi:hypothetical protein